MQFLLAGPPREVTVRPHIAAIILTSLLQKVKHGMAELGRDPNLLSSSLVFLTPFVSACLSVCLLVSDSDSVSVSFCLFLSLSLSLSTCLSVCRPSLPLPVCMCVSFYSVCMCVSDFPPLSLFVSLSPSFSLSLPVSLLCVSHTPTHPPFIPKHAQVVLWCRVCVCVCVCVCCVCVCVCVCCVRACLGVCVGGSGGVRFVRGVLWCAWAYDLSAAVFIILFV